MDGLAIDRLYRAIESVSLTVSLYDTCEYFKPDKYIYTKQCVDNSMIALRVVTEIKNNVMQVKSLHFRYIKRPNHGG